jgi:predicted RNA binding protein YcfA (HicA-like mRNA interferase family)
LVSQNLKATTLTYLAILRKAGFEELPGKGSHANWIHPRYPGKITVSGKDIAKQAKVGI